MLARLGLLRLFAMTAGVSNVHEVKRGMSYQAGVKARMVDFVDPCVDSSWCEVICHETFRKLASC
jgi:hypothetical protein